MGYPGVNPPFDLSLVFLFFFPPEFFLFFDLSIFHHFFIAPEFFGEFPSKVSADHLLYVVNSSFSPLHPHLAREVLFRLEMSVLALVLVEAWSRGNCAELARCCQTLRR